MLPNEMRSPLRLLLVSLAVLVLVSGCASLHKDTDLPIAESEVETIHAIVSAKEDAIKNGDIERFMALLDANKPEYLSEQKHWLQYYKSAVVSDYQLKISDIARRDPEKYVATLTQQYRYGPKKKERKCRFNQTFVKTQQGWKDSDLEFKQMETDHFVLMAMDTVSESTIAKIAKDAAAAFRIVDQIYGETPRDKTVIKIYNDPALVRELTKITADRVMYGWYEYPESIKLVARKESQYSYVRSVAHELMHKTSLTTARNQCPWFAEGLAVYFGTFPAIGGTYIDKGWVNSSEMVNSIDWLESQNPESLNGRDKIGRFYGTSGMVIKHIEAVYGKGQTRKIVQALGTHPQKKEGFEYAKHNKLYTEQLHDSIQEVLGVDPHLFNQRWMEWIQAQSDRASN